MENTVINSNLSSDKKIILKHSDLAREIEGKKILHLNSMGKDSAVVLDWLNTYARPSKIVAVNYEFISKNPHDDIYLQWQKKRYPRVEFITMPNPHELSNILRGTYQFPEDMLFDFNYCEYDTFSIKEMSLCLLKELELDFISSGFSKYESVTRAQNFYKKGIMQGKNIYPIGMFTKDQVMSVIKGNGIKLHPCYKFAKSTYDTPSYWKMRNAMLLDKEYRKNILKAFPLLILDQYRYEVMLEKK